MFKRKNYFILIGCNYNEELCGCTNDAVAMYNTFQLVPNSEYHLLKDSEHKITKESIKKIVIIFTLKKDSNVPYQIIFSFAGHGYNGGIIRLSQENINCQELYELFNSESHRKFDLLIILDCCYSGGFNLIKKYGNIGEVIIIPCNSSQNQQKVFQSLKKKKFLKRNMKFVKMGITILVYLLTILLTF